MATCPAAAFYPVASNARPNERSHWIEVAGIGQAGARDLRFRNCHCIYIASPEGDTGKSTVALGILHRLTATVPRVGVFRPITRRSEGRSERPGDYILELLLAHTTAGLPYDDCVGVGYQRLHEDPDGAIADIVDRFHGWPHRCDAVLIVGSDYTDVASPSELSVNARIAANLGAPVVLAVRAAGRTPDGGGPGRRGVSGRDERPARVHRGDRRQPVRPGAAGRDRRRAEQIRAESLCAARRTAAGGAVGGRAA